jgi:hypothetical protein
MQGVFSDLRLLYRARARESEQHGLTGERADLGGAKANHFGPGITTDFVCAYYEGARKIAVTGEAPGGTGAKGIGSIHGVHGQNKNGVGVRVTSSVSNLGVVEGHNDGGGAEPPFEADR